MPMAYAVLDDAIYPHKDHGRNNAHKYMFVHVRVANLLGSFYELSTLKLIYTGCTAAAWLHLIGQLYPSNKY